METFSEYLFEQANFDDTFSIDIDALLNGLDCLGQVNLNDPVILDASLREAYSEVAGDLDDYDSVFSITQTPEGINILNVTGIQDRGMLIDALRYIYEEQIGERIDPVREKILVSAVKEA